MSFLTRMFGKPKKEIKELGTKPPDKQPPAKSDSTGTTLRSSDEPTRITKKKSYPELTTLQIADKQDWEVKTLPVWQPGDVILDTYEVEDVISGGMGYVYIANHNKWNVKLAIKSPNEKMLSDRSNFARILREANSWTELGLHPNIAYCYYVRNIEDVPHIFVEYVDGGNLRQWIEEGKCIDYRTNLDLAIQFCHGMEHAHSKGMIHRDIKPENILMSKDGILKITDFGLVRGGDTEPEAAQSDQRGTKVEDSSLTVVGAEMGTWGYVSPEQKENPHVVDERTDIFAFGICLYEMFCGNKPYEVTFGSKQEPPDPVKLSGDDQFPSDIAAVLAKCAQWEPQNRYLNFKEIRQEISAIYKRLFDEESPYAELELLDIEADGLNNRGIAFFELGRKEDAIGCWEKALEINRLHLETTYNYLLTQWRSGKKDDLEVLRRLDNCGANPLADKEKVAELKARIHCERFAPDGAIDVLKIFPGRYDAVFSGKIRREIKCLHTIKRHTGSVDSVSVTPDGRYAVSGSWDNTIRLWALQTGQCLRVMEGHDERINSVSLTPDGRYAVSGSYDNTIRMWELETGRCLHIMEGNTGNVRSVAITPNGRSAVSGNDHKTLQLWDLETGQCLRTMEGHSLPVCTVAITPDGRCAVSGSSDNTLRLWELVSGECLLKIENRNSWVNAVSVTHDARYTVSGSSDSTLRMWDLETGQCLRTMEGHTHPVNSVSITPDGRYAVSGSYDKTIRLWELKTGRCLRTLEEHTGEVRSVDITPDSRYAVSGSWDNTIRLWALETVPFYQAELIVSLPKGFDHRKKEEEILKAAVQEAGELFKKKDYKQSFLVLYKAWEAIGFSQRNVINRLYSRLIEKGRIKDLTLSFQKKMLEGHTEAVLSVSITPDGRYAVSGSKDKTLRLWDLEKGKCLRSMEGHTDQISSVSLTSDGRYAISGSLDRTGRIWETETGKCLHILEEPDGGVCSVCLTPDGRYAVSGSYDKILRLWDIEAGQCLRIMEGHASRINSVSLTPDGLYAVSGSEDKTLRMWELETGQCLRIMKGHEGLITSVSLTPDARYAVSGGMEDKTLRLWQLESGKCLRTMEDHTFVVSSVCLTPNGRYAVSGSWDRTMRMWELDTGRCLSIMEGHDGSINSVSLTPTGRYAVSGGDDKTLIVWEFIWDLEFD